MSVFPRLDLAVLKALPMQAVAALEESQGLLPLPEPWRDVGRHVVGVGRFRHQGSVALGMELGFVVTAEVFQGVGEEVVGREVIGVSLQRPPVPDEGARRWSPPPAPTGKPGSRL